MLLLSISSLNKSKLEYRLKVLSNKINRKLHLRTYKLAKFCDQLLKPQTMNIQQRTLFIC